MQVEVSKDANSRAALQSRSRLCAYDLHNFKKPIMKYIILLITVSLLVSCSGQKYYCTPSKKSRDYAVRQWTKQRSDGYYVVTTIKGFGKMSQTVFECKPDSIELEKLKGI